MFSLKFIFLNWGLILVESCVITFFFSFERMERDVV